MEGIYMRKSGKVINFDDNKVYVVTSNKEFVTLEKNNKTPVKGSIYEGTVHINKSNIVKIFTILICLSILVIGFIYFIFFSPRANIILSIDSNIKIGINRNKIVKITDSSGTTMDLENFTSLKGNELNLGLNLLFDSALKEELIPQCDEYSPGNIYIYIIKDNKREPLNFDAFKNYASKFNYKIIVNRNDNTLNID
jgi:hypothetical protein